MKRIKHEPYNQQKADAVKSIKQLQKELNQFLDGKEKYEEYKKDQNVYVQGSHAQVDMFYLHNIERLRLAIAERIGKK